MVSIVWMHQSPARWSCTIYNIGLRALCGNWLKFGVIIAANRWKTPRLRSLRQRVQHVEFTKHTPAHPQRRKATPVRSMREALHRLVKSLLSPHDAHQGTCSPLYHSWIYPLFASLARRVSEHERWTHSDFVFVPNFWCRWCFGFDFLFVRFYLLLKSCYVIYVYCGMHLAPRFMGMLAIWVPIKLPPSCIPLSQWQMELSHFYGN